MSCGLNLQLWLPQNLHNSRSCEFASGCLWRSCSAKPVAGLGVGLQSWCRLVISSIDYRLRILSCACVQVEVMEAVVLLMRQMPRFRGASDRDVAGRAFADLSEFLQYRHVRVACLRV